MANHRSVTLTKDDIEENLKLAPEAGKRLLKPLLEKSQASGMPLNILEDTDVWNDAEIHTHEDDIWYCLEGEVNFIYGGEMIDPWVKELPDGSKDYREVKAKEIKGGTSVTLKPGDWLWIPAGEAHQHGCKGTARLVIIKVPKK